jgi:hypothetical protein
VLDDGLSTGEARLSAIAISNDRVPPVKIRDRAESEELSRRQYKPTGAALTWSTRALHLEGSLRPKREQTKAARHGLNDTYKMDQRYTKEEIA